MEDLERELERNEPEKNDYPMSVEVTLQDCQGKPPFPHHLIGQGVSREPVGCDSRENYHLPASRMAGRLSWSHMFWTCQKSELR